jgi:hypothetical protein
METDNFMAWQPLVGEGFLIIEASRSYSDTSHSEGLLCTRDQPVAETSTWQQHNTYKRQTFPPGFLTVTPAGEKPQAHAWDRAAVGSGKKTDFSQILGDF